MDNVNVVPFACYDHIEKGDHRTSVAGIIFVHDDNEWPSNDGS